MAGMGNSPFGLFPFGVGSTDEPPPLLGETEAARFIDPNTKDFSSTQGTGRLDAMPVLRQRVLLAITTTLQSSSAQPGLGLDLSALKKIDAQFVSRVKAKVNQALNQMTNIEKVIRVNDIGVNVGSAGRAIITVAYTDLSTTLPDSVSTN